MHLTHPTAKEIPSGSPGIPGWELSPHSHGPDNAWVADTYCVRGGGSPHSWLPSPGFRALPAPGLAAASSPPLLARGLPRLSGPLEPALCPSPVLSQRVRAWCRQSGVHSFPWIWGAGEKVGLEAPGHFTVSITGPAAP